MSDAVSVAGASVLEPLTPLVRAGYKSLADRAIKGVKAWYSAFSPETRDAINGKLALLKLPTSQTSAPKLYSPSGEVLNQSTIAPSLYAVRGGMVRETVPRSGTLLEDTVSGAGNELAALASTGDVGLISPASLNMLFFALDYSAFTARMPISAETLQISFGIAVSHYQTVDNGEFVKQLAALPRRGIISAPQQKFFELLETSPDLRNAWEAGGIWESPYWQGVYYGEDKSLKNLVFLINANTLSMVNIVNTLRLLCIAANSVRAQHWDLSELRERIIAVADARGTSSINEAYLADDSNLQGVAEQLDKVALHKGVEQIIAGSNKSLPELEHVLNVLRLTKLLDTIRTGKVALEDKDKPYSDAIGLAELVG